MSVRVEGQGSAGEGQGRLAGRQSATCRLSLEDGEDHSAKNGNLEWMHVYLKSTHLDNPQLAGPPHS